MHQAHANTTRFASRHANTTRPDELQLVGQVERYRPGRKIFGQAGVFSQGRVFRPGGDIRPGREYSDQAGIFGQVEYSDQAENSEIIRPVSDKSADGRREGLGPCRTPKGTPGALITRTRQGPRPFRVPGRSGRRADEAAAELGRTQDRANGHTGRNQGCARLNPHAGRTEGACPPLQRAKLSEVA